MPCLSTERLARIEKQIAAYESQLDALNAQLITNSSSSVKEYDWQDGGGRQAVKRKSDKDILQEIERIESFIDRLYRIKDGTGNPKINGKAY
jgi:uncharacterized protein Yka (UPF0111/DUF47 family)